MRYSILVFLLLFFFRAESQYQSQLELSKKFSDGNYIVYRNDQGKLDKVAKLWPISIVRSGDVIEKIIVKRAGVVDEEYIPDLKDAPGYFVYEDYRLIFLDNMLMCYKQSDNGVKAEHFQIVYEFMSDAAAKTMKFDEAKEYLASYRKATLSNQSNTRESIAKTKEANEAKEREANSLKGKNVKSLQFKPVNIPAKVGHYTKLEFGIVATLQDGKELKTKNIGGLTDFEFSYDISTPGCTFADGMLEVGDDASQFPTDEIVITIKNMHNPSQSIQQKITLTYDAPINFSFEGKSGFSGTSGANGNSNNCNGRPGNNGDNGGNGKDITIKLVETKHKKTNETIYLAEMNVSEDDKQRRLKISPSATVKIVSKGADGMRGGDGGRNCSNGVGLGGSGGNGGAGGRGGHVTLTKATANINTSIFNVQNTGGKGGPAGKGGSGASAGFTGRAGEDGKLNVQVSPVKLNW